MAFERFSGKKARFNFDSKDLEFTNLNDYVKENGYAPFVVRAVFNHKKDGDIYPCVVNDRFKIWLPNHFVNQINDIISDPACVEAINNGTCVFKPYTYEKTGKYSGTYNSGEFADI